MYIFAGACKGDVNGAESWCQHNARGKSWVRVDLGLADDTPSGKWANPCETRVIRSIFFIPIALQCFSTHQRVNSSTVKSRVPGIGRRNGEICQIQFQCKGSHCRLRYCKTRKAIIIWINEKGIIIEVAKFDVASNFIFIIYVSTFILVSRMRMTRKSCFRVVPTYSWLFIFSIWNKVKISIFQFCHVFTCYWNKGIDTFNPKINFSKMLGAHHLFPEKLTILVFF